MHETRTDRRRSIVHHPSYEAEIISYRLCLFDNGKDTRKVDNEKHHRENSKRGESTLNEKQMVQSIIENYTYDQLYYAIRQLEKRIQEEKREEWKGPMQETLRLYKLAKKGMKH
jgi:hypothetical protein